MNHLRRTLRHAIHSLGNDYDFRVPAVFRTCGIIGLGSLAVALLLPEFRIVFLLVGIVLMLPALIVWTAVRVSRRARFNVRDRMVKTIGWRGNERVLDVGTGSGITLIGCAKQLTTGKGVGIDIYDANAGGGTAEVFWRNARAEGVVDKVELHHIDARQMSFEDESFDAIVSSFALHHMAGKNGLSRATYEMLRVLKIGGAITLCDISPMINITARIIESAGLSVQVQPFGRMYSLLTAQKKGKTMTPVHKEQLNHDHDHPHAGHDHAHGGHDHPHAGHDHDHEHNHDHDHAHGGHAHHDGEHDHHHHHHDHDHHHHNDHEHDHHHDHDHGHKHSWWENLASAMHLPGYSHTHDHADLVGQVSAENNSLAIRTVWLALLALGVTTIIQIAIVIASGSVALLADTVHNLGDSLNSIPLLIAFYLARRPANKRYTYGYNRAEDIAGIFIVLSIGFSAAYILWESFQKLINPQPLDNLGWVAAAAIIGFIGNELVGLMQIRVGRQIGSEAMVADGLHARTDGFTSLAVLIAVIGTWVGFPILDPIVGIFIGVIIVFITRDAALAVWHRLMDAVDPHIVENAEKIIREHEEVKGLPKLQMRWLGHQLYVELMLALDDKLTIAESEAITDHISHHLYHALPNLAQATISLAPHGGSYQHESAHHRPT